MTSKDMSREVLRTEIHVRGNVGTVERRRRQEDVSMASEYSCGLCAAHDHGARPAVHATRPE
jgi:hypothetical protein